MLLPNPLEPRQAEEALSQLAMQFRSANDSERNSIAVQYREVVIRLIESQEWDEAPPFEDQLPDEFMPVEFYNYWLH